jgi:hypothetical protein
MTGRDFKRRQRAMNALSIEETAIGRACEVLGLVICPVIPTALLWHSGVERAVGEPPVFGGCVAVAILFQFTIKRRLTVPLQRRWRERRGNRLT